MNKNGDDAAPLAHAMAQVRNWLHTADEHRLAVLDCLGIERVSAIKGIVIAGRDSGYEPEHLRRLKGVDRGRVRSSAGNDPKRTCLQRLLSHDLSRQPMVVA